MCLKWYYKVYEIVTQQGFLNGSTEALHGALLVTEELLLKTLVSLW